MVSRYRLILLLDNQVANRSGTCIGKDMPGNGRNVGVGSGFGFRSPGASLFLDLACPSAQRVGKISRMRMAYVNRTGWERATTDADLCMAGPASVREALRRRAKIGIANPVIRVVEIMSERNMIIFLIASRQLLFVSP